MNQLEKVQKTIHILQIFVKIAKIFCIVGGSICAVGALCSIVRYNGGQVFGLLGEPLTIVSKEMGLKAQCALLLSKTVICVGEAILLSFAYQYFNIEQSEGTPFTENGAEYLKKLGIRCIYIPIVASVILSVIMAGLDVEINLDDSNLPSVIIGILIILVSQIFRYGAELERREKD